jgi:nucleotide-binding universal stress UspA family protein
MYKRILCPIDGSQTSTLGMTEAIRLAKDQNAELYFLHVIDTYIPILDLTGELTVFYGADILHNNGKEILKKAKKAALKAGVNADTKSVTTISGHVSELIVAQAKEWPADLIVMGTHGLRGIARLVMGSDAETVVRTSTVPVLLVSDIQIAKKAS